MDNVRRMSITVDYIRGEMKTTISYKKSGKARRNTREIDVDTLVLTIPDISPLKHLQDITIASSASSERVYFNVDIGMFISLTRLKSIRLGNCNIYSTEVDTFTMPDNLQRLTVEQCISDDVSYNDIIRALPVSIRDLDMDRTLRSDDGYIERDDLVNLSHISLPKGCNVDTIIPLLANSRRVYSLYLSGIDRRIRDLLKSIDRYCMMDDALEITYIKIDGHTKGTGYTIEELCRMTMEDECKVYSTITSTGIGGLYNLIDHRPFIWRYSISV